MIDLCLAASIGLLIGQLTTIAPGPAILAAAGLSVVAWQRLSAFKLAVAMGAFTFGCFCAHGALADYERARAQARDALGPPETCGGTLRVISSPMKRGDKFGFIGESINLSCEGVARVAPGTMLRLYADIDDLARGDVLDAVLRLGAIEVPRNFEIEGGVAHAARTSATLTGGVLAADRVARDAYGLGGWIDRARAHARTRIEHSYPRDAAPMARALVLGENDLPEDDAQAFRTSGLSHLLAVSGTHIVLAVLGLVNVLQALLRRIEPLSARYDVGRFAAAVGIPMAWAYAEFAGAGGSVRRAACMTTAALLARVLARQPDGVRAFGLSLLAGATLDPLAAFDVSFGLSAGATAGLIILSRPLQRKLDTLPRPLPWIAAPVSATISASLFCLPWLTLLSSKFSVVGVLANVLAVPVGELVSLPACLIHLLASPVPSVERGLAFLGSGSLLAVRAIARHGAALEVLAFDMPRPTPWQLATVAVTAAAMLCFPKRRKHSLLMGAATWLLFEGLVIHIEQPTGKLRVTVLDVGQGDSIIVDFPDGQAMLIDGGGVVGSPVDPGTRVVLPVLRARRRDTLGLAVLSHPHPDHFIGLASVLPQVDAGTLWDTGQGERQGAGPIYKALIEGARSRGVPVRRPPEVCGRVWSFGEAQLRVLGPCPDINERHHANDNSYVFHVRLGERSALLVGDAELEQETDLLRLGTETLRSDLLKVGHHGSRTSSTPAFIDAVRPAHAVITSGVRNRYGHPAPETIQTLLERGIAVYRSDRHGAVSWETDGQETWIHTAVDAPPIRR